MKLLCFGLPRTGTKSLAAALKLCGYSVLHHDLVRLDLNNLEQLKSWRLYDDIDCVLDLPTSFFVREMLEAYPHCRVIITIRSVDTWWESIKHHVNKIHVGGNWESIQRADRLHSMCFGSSWPQKYLWTRQFSEYYANLDRTIPHFMGPERVLCIDICNGDKWDKLCPFLGQSEYDREFPWENKKQL